MKENNNEQHDINPADNMKRFFRIWKPVIFHQIGLIAASIFMSFIVTLGYYVKHPKTVIEAVGNRAVFERVLETLIKLTDQYALVTTGAASLIVFLICFRMYQKDEKERMITTSNTKKKNGSLRYVFLIGLCISIHYVLNNIIFASKIDVTSESYQRVQEMFYAPSLLVQFIVLVLLSPICEELIYRGLVYKRLREKNSFIRAALLSSLIFSVIHGNLVQMFYAFCMGMFLCFLMERFGNLKASMIAHVFMNFLSIVLTEAGIYNYLVNNEQILMITTVATAGIGASFFLAINNKAAV